MQKTGGVTATYTLFDDAIDSEVLSDGSAIYAHGVSGILSENRGGTSKFYHADALGSVRALTNGSGTVTDSKSTDSFGLVVTSSGSTPTPFGFAGNHGYQQDSETGLMRLGHRMYDASTGRFISRDPIRDGYNWYRYAAEPVNLVDPTGLEGHQAGVHNDSTVAIPVIVTPIKGSELPSDGQIPIKGGKNSTVPSMPVNSIGGDGKPDPSLGGKPAPNKGIIMLPPGATVGGPGTNIDVDGVWVPGIGWVHPPGAVEIHFGPIHITTPIPVYTPLFHIYPPFKPNLIPGSHWSPPNGYDPIPFKILPWQAKIGQWGLPGGF